MTGKDRRFALGTPGALLQLAYPLATKRERMWTLLAVVLTAICGLILISPTDRRHPRWPGAVSLGVSLALVTFRGRVRTGELVLDATDLTITSDGKRARFPLTAITSVSRRSPAPDVDELVIAYRTKPPAVTVAVALLPRATADELETRIRLRARAATTGEGSAAGAAEALYLAGEGSIGVVWEAGGWRPFGSAGELRAQLVTHPFRTNAKVLARVPICVTARVWAVMAGSGAFSGVVKPLILPDAGA